MESALQGFLWKARVAIQEDLEQWLKTKPEIVSIEVRTFYYSDTDFRLELLRVTGIMDIDPDFNEAYYSIQDYFRYICPTSGFKNMLRLLGQYNQNHFSVKNTIHEK